MLLHEVGQRFCLADGLLGGCCERRQRNYCGHDTGCAELLNHSFSFDYGVECIAYRPDAGLDLERAALLAPLGNRGVANRLQ